MTVDFAVDRGVATLTLNSPANRNALSSALVGALSGHLRLVAADDLVRAVVLTHTGSTFCAGVDLREQQHEGGPEAGTRRMMALLRQITDLPKPVIVGVNGHVRAGGLGIVGASDIAIAGPAATFAFTEARLGLAAAIISLTTLPRLTGRAAARYLLTGETFDAAAAAAAGLITIVSTDLEREITRLADQLRICSPQGLAESKALCMRGVRKQLDRHADAMQQLSARLFASDEAQEGIRAFFEKREPRWIRNHVADLNG